jgi:hypothetical protein
MLTKDIVDLFRDQSRELYDFFNSDAVIDPCDYSLDSYLTYPTTITTLSDGLPIRIQYHKGRIMVHTGTDYSIDYIISSYSFWEYGRIHGKMSEYDIFYKLLIMFADIISAIEAFDYDEAYD